MQNRFSHIGVRRVSLLLLALSLSMWHPVCGAEIKSPIQVDLRKGVIGSISTSDSPEQLKVKLGNSNVTPFTGESEGEQYRGYKLRFQNNETVTANQSFLAITTKGFRTADGIGVGSSWREFKKAFSDGELSWLPDANAIWSEKYRFRVYFKGNEAPKLSDHVISIEINRGRIERW